jgi:crotonobetainyl-CoA:carnitine CoA-transferase CaiB-like acyl-CoA transferase
MRRHFHHLLSLVISSPLWAPATAMAQNVPRDPQISQRSPIWLGYLVAGVFGAILIVLTLLPSKRQHEDL